MDRVIVLKRLVIFFLFVWIGICGFLLFQGYETYQIATKHDPLQAKIEEIHQKDDYVHLEKIPISYQKGMADLQEEEHSIAKQLAKNLYFQGKQTTESKIAQQFLAKEIEERLQEKEILELYINMLSENKPLDQK